MLHQTQSTKQEQHLSAQMIHALAWLQVPTIEINKEIEKQRCENPLIEESNDSSILMHSLPTISISSFLPQSPLGVSDELYQFTIDSITQQKSLQELLDEQLNFLEIPIHEKECVAFLMTQLDSNGYLPFSTQELVSDSSFSEKELNHAIQILQEFDPSGIGARDIKECFLLQLKRQSKSDSLTYKIINSALSKIEKNDIIGLSKEFEVKIDEIYDAIEEMRHLVPYPGKVESDSPTFYVIPEIAFVENDEGEFEPQFIKESIPKISLSDDYLALLENPNTPEKERQFLRDKLISARGLLSALDNRYKTLYKIGEVLSDLQHDFLKEGEASLKPLTLRQIADRLSLNESTISRAISGKFAQTPHGIIELKSLFSSGFLSHEGTTCSIQSIKQTLSDLIKNENPKKPLSDSVIESTFKAQGITIARRTIAKYREELGILPTHLRKAF